MHHLVPHIDIAIVLIVILIILYRPPRSTGGFMQFIERHLGDSVGFYIIHLGIALVVVSGAYPQIQGVYATGQSLILAGMTALKLTSKPSDVGATSTSTTTVSSTVTEPPKEEK